MGFLRGRQKFAAAAFLLAISAFLSRLMGLIRDKIISWQFGAGGEADMYFAAFVVPDIINYLLAGGFMSITLVPLLARGFEKDDAFAWSFFSCVLSWMILGSTLLTLGCEIFAAPLARAVAPGFAPERLERLAFFTRLILPAQIFFLTGACFTALLLLRRQFAVPALTPLVYNGAIILCGLLLPFLFPADDFGMTGYCVGVTLGAFLGAFLLPFCAANSPRIPVRVAFRHPWLFRYLLVALPLMLGQTVVMLDEQFLRVFGSLLDEGAVSLLNYARRVAQVPVALMGQAIAAASYPFLARLFAQKDEAGFNSVLNKALIGGVELVVPTALCMIACANPILTVIFQGGRFDNAATLACEPLTQIMLLFAPFWLVYMAVARGYYAREDTLTPAITGTIVSLACVPLYYFVALPLGAWAIALVSGAGLTAYVVWLISLWFKRLGGDAFRGLAPASLKALACAVPAAICAWLAQSLTRPFAFPDSPFLAAFSLGSLGALIFSLIYFPLVALINPALKRKILDALKRASASWRSKFTGSR